MWRLCPTHFKLRRGRRSGFWRRYGGGFGSLHGRFVRLSNLRPGFRNQPLGFWHLSRTAGFGLTHLRYRQVRPLLTSRSKLRIGMRRARTEAGTAQGRSRCPFGPRDRQQFVLRKRLATLGQGIGRYVGGRYSRWPGFPVTGYCGCCRLVGGIDRGARRHRLFALLDQRGLLLHRLRHLGPCPARPAGSGRGCGIARRRRGRRLVDDVVDDGGVVAVGEDDVVARRRDIHRRADIDRDRHEERLRQDK
jgi:hypothetical protein